jgi:hypothetical protein
MRHDDMILNKVAFCCETKRISYERNNKTNDVL